ncbi:MAG: hypothetical protein JJT94_02935 [Bernardetiaceae bacterium]|nr:hypothetical protein [Bernardetiaceae bacterium]
MKNIYSVFRSLAIVFALTALFACEEEKVIYEGQNFVYLGVNEANPTINITAGDTLRIPIYLSAPRQSQETVVNIAFDDSTAAQGRNYRLLTGSTYTFPAHTGENATAAHLQFIEILALEDPDFAPDGPQRWFRLSIADNSRGFFNGMPGDYGDARARASYANVRVRTPDPGGCPFTMEDFARTWQAVIESDDIGRYEYQETTVVAGGNSIIIQNFFDFPVNVAASLPEIPIEVFFEADDNSVLIPVSETGLAAGGDPLLVEGSGTFDPCDKTFTFSYRMFFGDSGDTYDSGTYIFE